MLLHLVGGKVYHGDITELRMDDQLLIIASGGGLFEIHLVQGVRAQRVLCRVNTRFGTWLPVASCGRLIGPDGI